ncbi:MAG: hypothetical protein AAGF12_16920 [Myxococcota bacterium]
MMVTTAPPGPTLPLRSLLPRSFLSLSLLSLSLLSLSLLGCATETRRLASDRPPLDCTDPIVLGEGLSEVSVDDIIASGSQTLVAWTDGARRYFRLVDGDGSLQGEGSPLPHVRMFRADVASEPSGGFRVAFQNHQRLGAWRVFTSRFAGVDEPMNWDEAVDLSAGMEESIRPILVRRGEEWAVAYWYGFGVGLSIFGDDAQVRQRSTFAEGAQNAWVRAVVPTQSGYALVLQRGFASQQLETYRLDADGGVATRGPDFEAWDGKLVRDGLRLFVAADAGLSMVGLDATGRVVSSRALDERPLRGLEVEATPTGYAVGARTTEGASFVLWLDSEGTILGESSLLASEAGFDAPTLFWTNGALTVGYTDERVSGQTAYLTTCSPPSG